MDVFAAPRTAPARPGNPGARLAENLLRRVDAVRATAAIEASVPAGDDLGAVTDAAHAFARLLGSQAVVVAFLDPATLAEHPGALRALRRRLEEAEHLADIAHPARARRTLRRRWHA